MDVGIQGGWMDVGIQGGLDGWKKYKVDGWMERKNTRWMDGLDGLDGLDGWMDVRVDVSVFALRLSQICKVRKARSC